MRSAYVLWCSATNVRVCVRVRTCVVVRVPAHACVFVSAVRECLPIRVELTAGY